MRVAREIVFRQVIVPKPRGVVVAEPISPIIPMAAILSLPRDDLESSFVRLATEVVAAEVDGNICGPVGRWRTGSLSHYRTAAAAFAVGAVEPIVQPVVEAVRPMLLITFGE